MNEVQQIFDAIEGAEYVYRDDDSERFAVWSGAGIFNVYSFAGEPLDCWTTDGAPGPEFSPSHTGWENSRCANHGEAIRWAEAECREYFSPDSEDEDEDA